VIDIDTVRGGGGVVYEDRGLDAVPWEGWGVVYIYAARMGREKQVRL
jgi:hypothetical protein